MMRSEVCENFLKHNEVQNCSIIDQNDEGSFTPGGCDCCNGLATNTYECHGYSKEHGVMELGNICHECVCYFYNGDDSKIEE